MPLSSPPENQNRRRRQPYESPLVVKWPEWYDDTQYTWTQGMHRLFVGPTQVGKTTLCRMLVKERKYVVVLGTKPKDPSLDDYIRDGFKRITYWPPKRKDMETDQDGNIHLIVWPKITKREEMRSYAPLFAKVIDDVFVQGGWTIVIDEGLWIAGKDGLNLGANVSDLSYGSASNKVTMCLLVQRPAGLPRIAWQSVLDAMIFHLGVTTDLSELASLGQYDPYDVKIAIQRLKGRQFLDLPCRGMREWSVTEVEL